MTTDAAVLLSDLRRDHRNISIVLGILEQELKNLIHTETPDFELAHDVMRYMIVYSDAVHHPKEDVLYARMRTEIPAVETGLERIETDHREIAVLGENLRRKIEAIISGSAVTRISLITDSTDYILRLRNHMAWEEEDLFCRADELIRDRGSLPLDLSHLGSDDPIFGSEREKSFARLLQHILEAQN